MASVEMKNLRSFPIEKLCFDLKLDTLKQMEPKDVYELAKVNQGFQGMLVRDPSIVFGEHVYRIRLFNETIGISKLPNSIEMELNFGRPFSHFSFVKKIQSCDLLWLLPSRQLNEIYTLLKNLKSVNRLELRWISLEIFFSNFHASIKKEVRLDIYFRDIVFFNDQVIKDSIENFLVGPQLKDCEKISFDCDSEDSVRFCYNTLSKSQIKNVAMRIYVSMDFLIQQIITNGIPSKNPEAAIFLSLYGFYGGTSMDLSQYPRMRRIGGENRLRLLKQANYLARNCGYSGSLGFDYFMEESSMFRRRFDSTKDCIYVYEKEDTGMFLAFYVPID